MVIIEDGIGRKLYDLDTATGIELNHTEYYYEINNSYKNMGIIRRILIWFHMSSYTNKEILDSYEYRVVETKSIDGSIRYKGQFKSCFTDWCTLIDGPSHITTIHECKKRLLEYKKSITIEYGKEEVIIHKII